MTRSVNLAILILQAGVMFDILQTSQAFIPHMVSEKALTPFLLIKSRTSVVGFMSNVENEEAKVKTDKSLYDDEVCR